MAEIGFAEAAGLTVRSPRFYRRLLKLSGCAESISSPALSLDSQLLRCLVVGGSALVSMVIIVASLLGTADVGAVPWVYRPDVWTMSSVSMTADVTKIYGSL